MASADAAGLGHPAGERHAWLPGVRQVADVHQLAEHLRSRADPAEAGAGDVDPVVARRGRSAWSSAAGFQAPVGAGHLGSRCRRTRSRNREEHVVQFAWQQPGDLLGQLKDSGWPYSEARRVVEGAELASHRLPGFCASAGAAGPQAGQAGAGNLAGLRSGARKRRETRG